MTAKSATCCPSCFPQNVGPVKIDVNGVFGALIGVVFLGERLGARGAMAAGVILRRLY